MAASSALPVPEVNDNRFEADHPLVTHSACQCWMWRRPPHAASRHSQSHSASGRRAITDIAIHPSDEVGTPGMLICYLCSSKPPKVTTRLALTT
jgi:hypothetical protein